MVSLGNIETTLLAGVTFVSFLIGAVLYLTGDAHNLAGPLAQRVMPRINALTTILQVFCNWARVQGGLWLNL